MGVIVDLRADFWSHIGATPPITPCDVSSLVRGGETPVNDFEVEVGIETDVLRLQVPMTVPIVLHVLHTIKKLPRHMPDLIVFEGLLTHVVKQLAIRCVFLHRIDDFLLSAVAPDVATLLADVVEADHVFMGWRVPQRIQLTLQILHLSCPLRKILEPKHLNSVGLTVSHSQVHLACVALPELSDQPVLINDWSLRWLLNIILLGC